MISANYVVGIFDNIYEEQEILIPNAGKIIFVIDGESASVSVNDNLHHMTYKNIDGVIELYEDFVNSYVITKIYVKSTNPSAPTKMRIWAVV